MAATGRYLEGLMAMPMEPLGSNCGGSCGFSGPVKLGKFHQKTEVLFLWENPQKHDLSMGKSMEHLQRYRIYIQHRGVVTSGI